MPAFADLVLVAANQTYAITVMLAGIASNTKKVRLAIARIVSLARIARFAINARFARIARFAGLQDTTFKLQKICRACNDCESCRNCESCEHGNLLLSLYGLQGSRCLQRLQLCCGFNRIAKTTRVARGDCAGTLLDTTALSCFGAFLNALRKQLMGAATLTRLNGISPSRDPSSVAVGDQMAQVRGAQHGAAILC